MKDTEISKCVVPIITAISDQVEDLLDFSTTNKESETHQNVRINVLKDFSDETETKSTADPFERNFEGLVYKGRSEEEFLLCK